MQGARSCTYTYQAQGSHTDPQPKNVGVFDQANHPRHTKQNTYRSVLVLSGCRQQRSNTEARGGCETEPQKQSAIFPPDLESGRRAACPQPTMPGRRSRRGLSSKVRAVHVTVFGGDPLTRCCGFIEHWEHQALYNSGIHTCQAISTYPPVCLGQDSFQLGPLGWGVLGQPKTPPPAPSRTVYGFWRWKFL